MTALPVDAAGAAARWEALERATARTAQDARDRCLLAERLDQPRLLDDIDAVMERFDAGADPSPDDERRVSALLRARAVLATTAPSPDPLAATLARLDARWSPRAAVAWVLVDEAWAACFSGLPSPPSDAWWGARGAGSAPSEGALIAALVALKGERAP